MEIPRLRPRKIRGYEDYDYDDDEGNRFPALNPGPSVHFSNVDENTFSSISYFISRPCVRCLLLRTLPCLGYACTYHATSTMFVVHFYRPSHPPAYTTNHSKRLLLLLGTLRSSVTPPYPAAPFHVRIHSSSSSSRSSPPLTGLPSTETHFGLSFLSRHFSL